LVLQRRAVETLASMTGRFGMDATATGDAFALFGAASGLAAFLVDHLAPARLRGAVATCLVALGATMPLYLVVHGTVEVDVLMTFDGLLGDDGHGGVDAHRRATGHLGQLHRDYLHRDHGCLRSEQRACACA
jgi:hypothetical protein